MRSGVSAGRGLRRLAAAVLIPPFAGTDAPDWVLAELGQGLGGITIYGPNIAGPAQLAALTRRLASAAASPVIAIDEEGGDVTRIAHQAGSAYPGNAALGAVDDTALTEATYRGLGDDLIAGRQRRPGAGRGREQRRGQPGHRHPVVRLRP